MSRKENEVKEFYTARTDRVFKTIICDEKDKRILTKILEVILGRKLSEIVIMKNELPISNVRDRLKIVDLRIRTEDNEIIHVELNSSLKKNTKYRNYCYFCNTISTETKKGEEYNEKQEFIHIDLTYELKGKEEIGIYYVQKETREKYVDNIKIIEVNMDLLKKSCYNEDKYKYLAMLDMEPSELSKIGKGDKLIMEYKEKVEELNNDEEFQSYMSLEKAYQMEYNTDIRVAKEEGFEDGEKKGKREGKEEGILEKTVEMIKSMYTNNIPIENIALIANKDVEEVKKILEI